MLDGLILAFLFLAWGAQAVTPWRLPGVEAERRRLWAYSLLPLLTVSALAAIHFAQTHPDAAVYQGIYPLWLSRLGRILSVLFPALALADLVAMIGWRRLEDAGWRINAGFGLVFLLAASCAGELMRIGEGPESGPVALAFLVVLRTLLALGVAEALAPGRPVFAVMAGAALPFYYLLLPSGVAAVLWRSGQGITLGAASLLLLAARWLPAGLRRTTLIGAALLIGLLIARAGDLSQVLSGPDVAPMPELPGVP
jgi:hypothetical protein